MIDGAPANAVNDMTPRENHDLDIEVRVSRWPSSAEALELLPITIERPSTADFPTFRFDRPNGEPPFTLRQTQRAVLNVAQGLQARPFDFNYTAQFVPQSAEQPVAVVGMRHLRIESFDIGKAPLTGFHEIDRRLRCIRNELMRQPLITQADLGHALSVLRVLSALAGRALQDNLFPGILSEKKFQEAARDELRRDPDVASGFEEHTHVGGGITDLSFHQIRIELKSEPGTKLTLRDCEKYVDQAASYVASTGKRIGILCVLDCSPKAAPPFPADEGIGVLRIKTPENELCVGTVLIQGNLARPSDLSRRRGRPSR
ncbi:MAG: hypothetical protein KGJ66_04255 [Alphaproteobacteria bacterium]|nr:hypothetical protein [Alphaproteobacteria bacterium]